MNTQSSRHYEQLDQIAEEFAARFRKGETPSVSEYIRRYPELAEEIRELIPAMVEIEQVKPTVASVGAVPLQIGDYRIVREIGRGGMGVVYEAVQSSLSRHVALKVLPFHSSGDSKALERFKREARAAAKLHHTNIVPVFEVGENADVCFYAMQFIRGQGLDQVISELNRLRFASDQGKRTGAAKGPLTQEFAAPALVQSMLSGRFRLINLAAAADNSENAGESIPILGDAAAMPPSMTESEGPVINSSAALPGQTDFSSAEINHRHYFDSVACIGQQIAAGLAHAHERGIIHRDIKPSNLLLDASGTVWITDFGLAKSEDGNLTNSGDILGTLRYMSPERFSGQSDLRADVYALGMTLYELLTLQPAFQSQDRMTLISQIATVEPARPRELDGRIPRDLETIVLKAIAKDPARRYQSASDMADDLRRFRSGEPIKARRTSILERTRLWCRRNKSLTGLYLVLLGAAVCSSVFASYLYNLLKESEAQQAQIKKAESETKGFLQESERQREKIATTERKGKEDLWRSYLAQARATRMTRQPGQRFGAIEAIKAALRLPIPPGHSLADLRTEAIAALCMPDIEVTKEWDGYPTGSSAFAIDVAFERYARADKDGNVSIRRVDDDAELMHLTGEGPCADYDGLVFSPDGRYLCVHLRRRTEQILWQINVNPPARRASFAELVFSPDGKRLAVRKSTGPFRILDISTLEELQRFDTTPQTGHVIWNPALQGELLWSDGNAYRILNTETGETGPSIRTQDTTVSPRWHPSGRFVAFSALHNRIQIWNLQQRKPLLPPLEGHSAGGVLFSFNHSGDMLASSDWTGVCRLWDTFTGRQILSLALDGHTLQFSRDDERFAAHAGRGKVRLFRVASGKEFRTIGGLARSKYSEHGNAPLHPNGRLLAAANDQRTVLVDVANDEALAQLPADHSPVAFETTGEALLTIGPRGLFRWPITNLGTDLGRMKIGPPISVQPKLIAGKAGMSSDGSVMAAATAQGTVIWRPRENRFLTTGDRLDDVRFCDVSPDGKWVATGSGELLDGSGAKIWDAATGKLVAELPLGRMCYVAFSPDGKWLLTSSGPYRLWEVGSWREGPSLGGNEDGQACAFTADSKWLALTDKPGIVRLIETRSGRELAKLTVGSETFLWPKSFTPDGNKLIVVGRESRTLYVFNLKLIREGLTVLNLDWDSHAVIPADAGRAKEPQTPPLQIQLDLGQT